MLVLPHPRKYSDETINIACFFFLHVFKNEEGDPIVSIGKRLKPNFMAEETLWQHFKFRSKPFRILFSFLENISF